MPIAVSARHVWDRESAAGASPLAATATVVANVPALSVGSVVAGMAGTATAAGVAPTVSGGTDTITHGSQITTANTGYVAYFDSGLGRLVTDSDLTVHNSGVLLSSLVANGGTVSKRYFAAGVTIDRDNVTFVACKFNGEVSGHNGGADRPFTLSYCTILTTGAAGDQGISFTNYAADRCNISGCSDGAKINGNCSITESYIRCKAQDSSDHNDGVQNFAGAGDVTIARCNVDVHPVNDFGTLNGNAALFSADGAVGKMIWNDNLLASGGYTMRLYENCTYECQGNWIINNTWTFGPVSRAVIPATNVTWGTIRPNLIVAPTTYAAVSTLAAP